MLPTEPQSIGGILDAGINLFRSSFKETAPVAAVTAIPYAIVSGILSARSNAIDPETNPEEMMAAAMEVFSLMPLLYLLLVLVFSALIHRQVAVARSQPTSLTEDLLAAVKLAIPMFILMVTYIILLSIGIVLFIIPGLIIAVSMALFLWVPLVEPERGAWGGLWRSHALIWGGNWWRTATVMAVVSIIAMVLSVVFYVALGVLSVATPAGEVTNTNILLQAFVTWASMALYAPLTAAMFLVLYNDLLLRKEGGDLDARIGDLEA